MTQERLAEIEQGQTPHGLELAVLLDVLDVPVDLLAAPPASAARALRTARELAKTLSLYQITNATDKAAVVIVSSPKQADAMTSRYKPNEPVCPVPLELITLLPHSDDVCVRETVLSLAPKLRVALAAYCYGRVHLRTLGFTIAGHCDEASVFAADGATGSAVFIQLEDRENFDRAPNQHRKQKVTLARMVA